MNEEWDLGFKMEEEETFETFPEMQYKVRCDNIERKESKQGGFNNLFWKMVVLEGDFTNKSIQGVTHLKPDVPHIGFLRACAALRPDIELKGTKFKPSDYIGKQCIIDVKHGSYTTNAGQERTIARIEDWLPVAGNMQTPTNNPDPTPTENSDATFE